MTLDNWIYDLYARIDAETRMPYTLQREFRQEISWAYRLGYLSHEEYMALCDYLETQVRLKEMDSERIKATRLAQIAYNQELMRQEQKRRDEITALFLRHCRYDRQTRLYYYKYED
ncbi:MAG: hypothetical protein K2N94_05945 [Lachnospiraceae bacterium]|nr:hypothetical protein [Lachnospiraceae bacterium]